MRVYQSGTFPAAGTRAQLVVMGSAATVFAPEILRWQATSGEHR